MCFFQRIENGRQTVEYKSLQLPPSTFPLLLFSEKRRAGKAAKTVPFTGLPAATLIIAEFPAPAEIKHFKRFQMEAGTYTSSRTSYKNSQSIETEDKSPVQKEI